MSKWFQSLYFDQGRNIHASNKFKHTHTHTHTHTHIYIYIIKKEKTNENLRRGHVLVNCRQVVWIIISNVQHYSWRCVKMAYGNPALEICRHKGVSLAFRISSYLRNSLCRCSCSPARSSLKSLSLNTLMQNSSSKVIVLSFGINIGPSATLGALWYRI